MAKKRYDFIIYGNQEHDDGNPIPKLRMTQKSLWTPQAKRYKAWGDYVRASYWRTVEFRAKYTKPFEKKFKGEMHIVIYWANEKHGDAEGIFGSIADALFENDKELTGSFVTLHSDEGNPRVEIVIFET